MQTISISPGALADLHQRLDRAMTHRDRAAITQVRSCCAWLVDIAPTVPIRQLQARAEAADRFLQGGSRHG